MGEAAHGEKAAENKGAAGMGRRGEVGPYDGDGFTFCDRERVEGLCRGETRASVSLEQRS